MIKKYARDQIYSYVTTLHCKQVGFIFPYMPQDKFCNITDDLPYSYRMDLKITPDPTFLKDKTLEKIFRIISDSVVSLKN